VPDAPDPIAAARVRYERAIAATVVGVALLGLVISGWRSTTVESTQGHRIFAFALVVGAFYGFVLLRRPRPGGAWIRATVEVSCATVVIALDALAGPQLLVSSSTSYLYMLAIGVTALRLDPRLTAYATILGVVEQAAVYLYAYHLPAMAGLVPMPRLQQELVFRLAVLALMGGLGMFLSASLRREIARSADEERLRTVFGRYVDRRILSRVLRGDLRLAPERREITVVFVDIRGFTTLSENRDPAEVFRLLSGTLDAFSQVIQAQGGIVNKYLGDGLLAFFGAPEEQKDHARRAARAALKIVEEASRRAQDGRFPGLRVGVGIHTGEAMVGDLGGERREFTAIGDTVNVAARVEEANKTFGTSILATGSAFERIGDGADGRRFAAVTLRGRSTPIDLWEVRAIEPADLSASLPHLKAIVAEGGGT